MIKKSTLIVLLCAVALGASVYYFDWKRSQHEKPAEDTSKPAFSIQSTEIVSLTLTGAAQSSESSIQLEKQNGVWQIVQPIKAAADQPAVESIVQQIADARISQTESGSADRRKAYGLDPAQAAIEFALQNGAKHTISLGNKDFTGTSVYALLDGGPNVALLSDVLLTNARSTVAELRDQRVARVDTDDVQRVEIHNSNGVIVVSRKKDAADEWIIDAPKDQEGKSATSWKITGALSGLHADEVIDHPPANLVRLLTNPAIKAVLTAKDGKVYNVRISKASGDFVYAQGDDRSELFKLKKQVLNDWDLKLADLVP